MVAIVADVEADLRGHVDEPAPAVVAEQHARRAVARVVIGHGRAGLVLAGTEEVRVDAEIEVEEAVAVEVGHRDAREHALQRRREREGVVDHRELPAAVVLQQEGLQARGEHQILIAVVVDVDEQRLRGVVEQSEPRALGRVLEGAVAARAQQTIGQPRRLGDVQIVEAIAVGIAHRHAVVAVGVTRQHGIDARHPRIEAGGELAADR